MNFLKQILINIRIIVSSRLIKIIKLILKCGPSSEMTKAEDESCVTLLSSILRYKNKSGTVIKTKKRAVRGQARAINLKTVNFKLNPARGGTPAKANNVKNVSLTADNFSFKNESDRYK